MGKKYNLILTNDEIVNLECNLRAAERYFKYLLDNTGDDYWLTVIEKNNRLVEEIRNQRVKNITRIMYLRR